MSSQGVQLTIDTLCQHGRRREERCVQMDPEQGCVINDAPSVAQGCSQVAPTSGVDGTCVTSSHAGHESTPADCD